MSVTGIEKVNPYRNTVLVAEKLEQWEWFNRFLELNPDVAERYAVYTTYEILKNDTRD